MKAQSLLPSDVKDAGSVFISVWQSLSPLRSVALSKPVYIFPKAVEFLHRCTLQEADSTAPGHLPALPFPSPSPIAILRHSTS